MERKRQNTRLSFTQCEHCSFPTDRLQQLNSCLYTKKRRGEKAHLKCGPQPPSAFSCCWKATISPTDIRVSREILAQLDISTIPSSLSDLSRSLFSSATTTKRKKKKKKRPPLSGNLWCKSISLTLMLLSHTCFFPWVLPCLPRHGSYFLNLFRCEAAPGDPYQVQTIA